MQQPAQAVTSPGTSSFAGLLAALTSPAANGADRKSESGEGELGEDVVTLSYERALRNHARYKPEDSRDWESPPAEKTEHEVWPRKAPSSSTDDAGSEIHASSNREETSDRDLRTASVTIRLSSAESARLHQRAAEAGVSVSAYLRSCTFEADALRAQVKSALAELRAPAIVDPENARPAHSSWMRKLLPAWPSRKSV